MVPFLADSLDILILVAFTAAFVTQVVLPILIEAPLFPLYRKWQAKRSYQAPVISIVKKETKPK